LQRGRIPGKKQKLCTQFSFVVVVFLLLHLLSDFCAWICKEEDRISGKKQKLRTSGSLLFFSFIFFLIPVLGFLQRGTIFRHWISWKEFLRRVVLLLRSGGSSSARNSERKNPHQGMEMEMEMEMEMGSFC
jgi:Na+/H+ antiporter NhaD/arsenite permease-like protein